MLENLQITLQLRREAPFSCSVSVMLSDDTHHWWKAQLHVFMKGNLNLTLNEMIISKERCSVKKVNYAILLSVKDFFLSKQSFNGKIYESTLTRFWTIGSKIRASYKAKYVAGVKEAAQNKSY